MMLREATGQRWLDEQVQAALAEDLGDRGDITCAATVPEGKLGAAELVVKADGVLCGIDWAIRCGELTTPAVTWKFIVEDGAHVKPGDVVAHVEGPLVGILISERTALNGLGRLSGIATMASNAAKLVEGTSAVVIDTRKTTPGWRLAEKYAVRCGGGGNHRIGLYDEILIKENHIESAGGIEAAIHGAFAWREAESSRSGTPIEVEVRDIEEFRKAFALAPDRILLDNFAPEALRESVEIAAGGVTLEASGGITLANLAEVAATGVDRISLGALTHSIIPLDLSLLVRGIEQGC